MVDWMLRLLQLSWSHDTEQFHDVKHGTGFVFREMCLQQQYYRTCNV